MAHAAFERRWAEKQPAYGGWLTENSTAAIDAYAQAGFDYVGIDCQHALLDETEVARIIDRLRDAPFAVLARPSHNAAAPIGKLLDAGADGVIIPGVNTRAEAEAAISASRYPPRGTRSLGPIRAGLGRLPEEIEARALCFLMIETKEGIDNLDEILSVPGVDCAYVGPSDLAYALGLKPTGDNRDEAHQRVCMEILEACKRHGVAPGMHTGSVEFTTKWLKAGFQMVTLGSDSGFMRAKAGADLAAARGDTGTRPALPEA